METWFLNHVLGLSLSVLLLALPGPLGAGTPMVNSTDPVTAGFFHSAATDQHDATSAAYSSESLSPSQRNLLTHSAETHTAETRTAETHTAETRSATAGNFDAAQTETSTETSNRSLDTTGLSTEPLTSTIVVATTEASSSISSSSISGSGSSSSISSSSSGISSSSGGSSGSRDWKDFVSTDQVPGVSHAMSSKVWLSVTQDNQDPTLRSRDTAALASQTAVLTDSTYTSSTISRVGERNLLSVTSSSSNSTSSAFTEGSNSHQPSSTWGVHARATETEDYTHSVPSAGTDNRNTTDTFKGVTSQTGRPGESRGTDRLTGMPNATQYQHTLTSGDTVDSTPPFRVTEPSTDQSDVSVSSTPYVTSPAGSPTNISGTEQESGPDASNSSESSTAGHSSSTQNLEGTEGFSSQTGEEHVGLGLTTASPTVSSSTSEMDDSLTITQVLVTKVVLTTSPITVTERSHITEQDTFKPTDSTTTTTPPPPATSSTEYSSATSSSTPESPTEATISYTTPSTTVSTLGLQTSAAHSTHRVSPSQTQEPSAGTDSPINITTLQTETTTSTMGVTTAHRHYTTTTTTTTTYTHRTPTRSTVALLPTRKQTDRGTTELVATTSPTDIQTTKAPPLPKNPCVSNPCMNGGMCVSSKGHQFTCHCQPGWTGPTCNRDVDECERDRCPVGSRCVNTRGSFSCECPLGFDLKNGSTCIRAKTFLGTFSVNRPHDPILFKSDTMHEIQREIIQLLNASLSVLRGYSRSTLSKKEEDGIRISAVNVFSISTNVTSAEVYNSIQMSLSNCSSSLAHCRMVLHHQLSYHVESLCVAQKTQCDTERSTCTDSSGTAYCQCLQGYYKHNPDDLSCLECGDGYKLENGSCVPCMFGFGGFNCGNFYKLIAVVVSPAGGALLLILIIALIVTCCKKDKNDLNKIIFKSGDLQMSPYTDFPKNNRISMEWGRETIEMQENGSTKNLLQMTDIYYSPALRNSDLERNGLYPFTGLPGSRHSCIYPAQWNPSFISDDSRRRDYF
ncbi:protein HEG [Mastacembelus armatus]|uniref:Heart development protein with EGF-like domains 1 n=1 Tax=Mastacembelus armatus TaxID=205130 RepID=A0A3Q3MS44_9TELE|nr:protein HEG homolog 1 [Mastacembelus armatus]